MIFNIKCRRNRVRCVESLLTLVDQKTLEEMLRDVDFKKHRPLRCAIESKNIDVFHKLLESFEWFHLVKDDEFMVNSQWHESIKVEILKKIVQSSDGEKEIIPGSINSAKEIILISGIGGSYYELNALSVACAAGDVVFLEDLLKYERIRAVVNNKDSKVSAFY